MTTSPDIISIVKEIQKSHDSILAGSDLTEVAMSDMLHLWHNFPAIAQALLITVKALEAIEKASDPRNDDIFDIAVRLDETLKQSRVALSALRPLPTS